MSAQSTEFLPPVRPHSPMSSIAWTERGSKRKNRDSRQPSSRQHSVRSIGNNRSKTTDSQHSVQTHVFQISMFTNNQSQKQKRVKKSEGKIVTEYYPRKLVWVLLIWFLILCAFGLLAKPPGAVAYRRQALYVRVSHLARRL